MAAGRHALLVATGAYRNPALRRLRSPASDALALGEVLGDPRIGDFEVGMVVDGTHSEVTQAIEGFFRDRRRDDLLLLHLSCHGLKNDDGELHFAAADTRMDRLASTSVPAQFVQRQMDQCRARSVVLLLDCCYSGAFLAGSKGDSTVHVKDELAGHGRVVLTATNRTEYAWEGERITETDPEPSRFTGALVNGLSSGLADRDRDGLIGVHELYDYVYDELQASGARQRPQMWAELEHRVVVARSVLPALPDGRTRAAEPAAPASAPAPAVPAPAPAVPAPAEAPPAERPAPGRPRGPLAPLLALTEALTGLSCMDDAPSRMQFAAVLGELLGRPIDLRGVRQREDVVAIVRAALNRGDGMSALLSVVEVFEGHRAADEVRRGLTPHDGRAARPASVPGARPRPEHREPRALVPGGRPEAPGAGLGGTADPAGGGTPGILRLSLLTDGLCELPCLEAPPGRMQFAAVLAEQLGRPVDLRGTRLREDAVTLARAALNVPGGGPVLVDVVRLFEGTRAGDDIEWLFGTPD
ncbi:caspase, EACC1-associated type [Streptomyces sp. SLBN-134]|uniref:caspase, EACC1-associated type n=1 Tax=Streptomyces sp. SLBN-134 TaxID=2768456 RepID=UPI001166C197|nr:caspase family protein [Streptomyces sp. SLBN-134]TQL19462.1 putative caspase-like protein [Streptomyces sp. SLBN-134]